MSKTRVMGDCRRPYKVAMEVLEKVCNSDLDINETMICYEMIKEMFEEFKRQEGIKYTVANPPLIRFDHGGNNGNIG